MMCLTEQKTERLIKLSKKDLMIMLEPYTDDSLICIGLQMQQGYVGFFDLEQDTKHKDKYVFVLNSDCFNEWYKKDIAELKEKIVEQQATIKRLQEDKPFIKIIHDYMIEYDGCCFSMHKPSDIRSFVYLMNRNNNFDELQCEYNDESMVIDDE